MLTGALLAPGQYQRKVGASMKFGAPLPSSRWRDLLTGADRDKMASTRAVLTALLDHLSGPGPTLATRLQAIQDDWLRKREDEQRFDWRYYLVRYPSMREGKSGIYRSADGTMGYSLCMLEGEYLNGYYRDPYLHALIGEARRWPVSRRRRQGRTLVRRPRCERAVDGAKDARPSGCAASHSGFEIKPPTVEEHQSAFETLVVARDPRWIGTTMGRAWRVETQGRRA